MPTSTAPLSLPESRLEIGGHHAGACLVIRVRGELDLGTAHHLDDAVRSMLRPSTRDLFVDLRHVSYCGSAGLRTFLALHECARRRGGTLTLDRPAPLVRRLLSITGLADLVIVRDAPAA